MKTSSHFQPSFNEQQKNSNLLLVRATYCVHGEVDVEFRLLVQGQLESRSSFQNKTN